MKKIFFVGGLTSGSGGMESAFKKLYTLLSDEFDVEFLILGNRRKKINKEWMNTVTTSIYGSSFFRGLSKLYFCHQLRKRIYQEKPILIIAYDVMGCTVASEVLKKINFKCPIISWIHFPFNSFNLKQQKRIMEADFHFAISKKIKNQMINAGIDEEVIHTIYNPVQKQYEIIERPNSEITNFLYVGRIQYDEQKNLQYMLKGLSKIPYDFTLNIVGNGKINDITRLKLLATELNIDNKIIWHGWQKNVWKYIINNIKGISALLMSSKYEGFPMTLGEAMSYGVFCISSNCETGPDEIITIKNGLLYDLNSPTDFVEKLNLFHDMVLPSPEVIKSSIHYLYDENYIHNIKRIFHEILD